MGFKYIFEDNRLQGLENFSNPYNNVFSIYYKNYQ